MGTRVSIITIVLLMRVAVAGAQAPPDGMPLPAPASELASAIGLMRADPVNLPLDLVRALYGWPDGAGPADAARAAVQRLLDGAPAGTERVPLPLGASVWRQRIFHKAVPDERLASTILGRRAFALIYHALLGVDPETLDWLAHNPGALSAFLKHPGATAVFARSLHVRDGALAVPGENADRIWTALVGAQPGQPELFITRLFDARGGRLAFLFDTLMHLDGAHQKFALTPARGDDAIARARALLDAVTDASPTWKIDERPFVRPDVDLALLLRLIAVTDEGTAEGVASRNIWDRGFGDRLDSSADAPAHTGPAVDAAWLAARILRPPAIVGRQRLDLFLTAQRVLPDASSAPAGRVLEALRGITRYPVLMTTLERAGVRGVEAYAAAARNAAGLHQDPDGLMLCQGLLAVVDRARAAGTVGQHDAARLTTSVLESAGAGRPAGPRLVQWMTTELLPALHPSGDGAVPNAEAIVMNALAGPISEAPPTIDWEDRRYQVDVAAGERSRIARIRKTQTEVPLDRALQEARSARGPRALAESLSALVYAVALGDPEGQALTGGAAWRRHRFKPDATTEDTTWRIATENFGSEGWHLVGSLLALEAALPKLALRRLDSSAMPAATQLSTSDRRSLCLTIALLERPMLTSDGQQSVAAAIARGRERVRALSADAETSIPILRDAGLSEWRANGVLWMLAADPPRVVSLFTLADLYRLGQGRAADAAWGGAALALDGSLTLRAATDAWEEYTGRPAMGQLGSQFVDVQLRTAEALAEFRLPASIGRDVAAFAMQDVLDRAQPAYFDDFLSLAFAARDLERDRFEDYVAALTASGPLVPADKRIVTRH